MPFWWVARLDRLGSDAIDSGHGNHDGASKRFHLRPMRAWVATGAQRPCAALAEAVSSMSVDHLERWTGCTEWA